MERPKIVVTGGHSPCRHPDSADTPVLFSGRHWTDCPLLSPRYTPSLGNLALQGSCNQVRGELERHYKSRLAQISPEAYFPFFQLVWRAFSMSSKKYTKPNFLELFKYSKRWQSRPCTERRTRKTRWLIRMKILTWLSSLSKMLKFLLIQP